VSWQSLITYRDLEKKAPSIAFYYSLNYNTMGGDHQHKHIRTLPAEKKNKKRKKKAAISIICIS
jgi:hypothetical protein